MVRPVAQGLTAFRRCPLLDVTHRRAGQYDQDNHPLKFEMNETAQ
jgi:hypothetical protein